MIIAEKAYELAIYAYREIGVHTEQVWGLVSRRACRATECDADAFYTIAATAELDGGAMPDLAKWITIGQPVSARGVLGYSLGRINFRCPRAKTFNVRVGERSHFMPYEDVSFDLSLINDELQFEPIEDDSSTFIQPNTDRYKELTDRLAELVPLPKKEKSPKEPKPRKRGQRHTCQEPDYSPEPARS
jgi:hypothetical protein